MGLISLGKKVIGVAGQSVRSVLGDSIRDYYECRGLNDSVLMVPGFNVLREGTRNNASENLISDGSVFDVSAGQCAIVLENGKIHDMVACYTDEGTGQYVFQTDKAPSFFGTDKFSKNLSSTFSEMAGRFTAGGQATVTHRIIYINLRPIKGMKAGTGGVTFRDAEMNISLQIGVHGVFSYTIADPMVFYTSCIHNPETPFNIEQGDGVKFQETLKTALKSKLKSTFSVISQMQIPYDQIQGNTEMFINAANQALGDSWSRYGITLDPVGSNFELDADEKSKKLIEDFQRSRAYGSDEAAYRGRVAEGQLEAMQAAASNSAGSAVGLMGMGMMGNMQANMGLNQTVPPMQAQPQQQAASAGMPGAAQQPAPAATGASDDNTWTCSCGTANTMKFCGSCGAKQPDPIGWTCACGTANTMKFCGSCGQPKPEAPKGCANCGWQPTPGENATKFCPNCGTAL